MHFSAKFLSSFFSIFILVMCQYFFPLSYDLCNDSNYLRLRKVTWPLRNLYNNPFHINPNTTIHFISKYFVIKFCWCSTRIIFWPVCCWYTMCNICYFVTPNYWIVNRTCYMFTIFTTICSRFPGIIFF